MTSLSLDRVRVAGDFDRLPGASHPATVARARSGSREPTIDARAGARKALREAAALLSGAAEDRDGGHGL